MYSVIIVDDESIVRSVVKNAVDWENAGFFISGEADNGKDALNLALELSPELMIIDINIPFIDGITLSTQIKQSRPDTEIIILTGYDTFEYTKGAIKAGVASYVLKPVNRDELLAEIISVKKKIDGHLSRKSYITSLEKREDSENSIIKQNMMRSLIKDSKYSNTQEIRAFIAANNLSFINENFIVIIIQLGKADSSEGIEDNPIWRFAVQNITEEILSEKCKNIVFDNNDNNIVIIAGVDGDALHGSLSENVIQCCEKIIFYTKKYIGLVLSIAIGDQRCGLDGVRFSYAAALKSMERKFIEGKGKIYDAPLPKENSGVMETQTLINNHRFLLNLRVGNKKELVADVNDLFKLIIEKKISIAVVELWVGNIVESLLLYLHEINMDENILLSNNINIYIEMKKNETVVELRDWVLGLINRLFAVSEDFSSMKHHRLVEKAKQYIEAEYDNPDLTLTEISNHLYTNPSYLSKIFKQTTQLTVGEHIRNIKLQKAKELFDQDKQAKVKMVAEKVGYFDALYFSKLFKAQYGISPKKYLKIK